MFDTVVGQLDIFAIEMGKFRIWDVKRFTQRFVIIKTIRTRPHASPLRCFVERASNPVGDAILSNS